jgi:hypothetical protein
MKCYNASFNVGNMEVLTSELYLKKKSVFEEIEEEIETIVAEISDFDTSHSAEEINNAVLKMLKRGFYKKDNLDFFVLEQYVWKDMQDRNIFTKNIKTEENKNLIFT